jgi:hypothetical protein
MWKTIVLCASLFASAALGILTAARWLEPAALPFAAAIGLCLIGIVLILAAPPRGREEAAGSELPVTSLHFSPTAPRLPAIEEPAVTSYAAVSGPHQRLH